RCYSVERIVRIGVVKVIDRRPCNGPPCLGNKRNIRMPIIVEVVGGHYVHEVPDQPCVVVVARYLIVVDDSRIVSVRNVKQNDMGLWLVYFMRDKAVFLYCVAQAVLLIKYDKRIVVQKHILQ